MIFFKFQTFCVRGGSSIYCQGVNLLPRPSCPGHTARFLIPAAVKNIEMIPDSKTKITTTTTKTSKTTTTNRGKQRAGKNLQTKQQQTEEKTRVKELWLALVHQRQQQ